MLQVYVTVPPATVLVGVPGDALEIDGGESQIAVIMDDRNIIIAYI